MITFILLTVIVMIAIGAIVVYKAVGPKGQVVERQANASTQGASTGRAINDGDN